MATNEVRFAAPGSERLARRPGSPRTAVAGLAAIFLFSAGAVAAALVSQHFYGMDPCPWCVLQRAIFVAIALAALLGLVWRRRVGRRIGAVLALLLALCGGAAALWQHFVAAVSPSCNLTLADRIMNFSRLPTLLPEVFEPRASCADAAVNLLGVPYDFWGLAGFAVVAVLALVVLSGSRGRPRPALARVRREPS